MSETPWITAVMAASLCAVTFVWSHWFSKDSRVAVGTGLAFFIAGVATSMFPLGISGLFTAILVAAVVSASFRLPGDQVTHRVFWGTLFFLFGLLSGPNGSSDPLLQWIHSLGSFAPGMTIRVVFLARKMIHVAAYGFLAIRVYELMTRCKVSSSKAVIAALGFATAFAIFDESRQAFSPNRTGQLADIGYDLFGACLFLFLTVGVNSLWSEKR